MKVRERRGAICYPFGRVRCVLQSASARRRNRIAGEPAGVSATHAELVKLNILSDLHLSLGALEIPRNDADAVILAGDIARPREAASWASGFSKPVLYVPGNHEFYGGSIVRAADELKQLCAGSHIRVLDNDEVIIDGVRFLGTTLWTDFMLFGEGEKRAAAMRQAVSFMRDFSRIRIGNAAEAQITVNKIVPVLFEKGRDAMTEHVTAWQCIGCGRIEGAQPCVGICQDRKTNFVYASDHDAVLAQMALPRQRAETLAALVRQLACTTPRKDEWERTYRALPARARRTLGTLANDEQSKPS